MFFHQFRGADLYIIVIDSLKGRVFRTPVKQIFISNNLWAVGTVVLRQVKMERQLITCRIHSVEHLWVFQH